MSKKRVVINKLGINGHMRLNKWLHANWAMIIQDCPSFTDLASEASDALQLPIVASSLKYNIDSDEGLEWPESNGNNNVLRQRINTMEENNRVRDDILNTLIQTCIGKGKSILLAQLKSIAQ